jgi:hypothetical protein
MTERQRLYSKVYCHLRKLVGDGDPFGMDFRTVSQFHPHLCYVLKVITLGETNDC